MPVSRVALASLLPLRGVVVILVCLEPTTLPFFHQPALTAFLRFLAQSPAHYDQLIRLDAPESGRVRYRVGDYYRFSLYGLAGSDELLATLLQQLLGLPQSAPKTDTILPFRNNWQVQALQDAFSGEAVQQLADLSCYELSHLEAEAQLWQAVRQVNWTWVSPVRLLKAKEQRPVRTKNTEDEQFVRDAQDASGQLVLSRVHNALSDLVRRRSGHSETLQSLPVAEMLQAHWFWVEVRYQAKVQDGEFSAKNMSGALGQFQLVLPEGLKPTWWALLVLGQYLGIGQRTAFGWGRYVLQTPEGLHSYRRVLPAHSLLVLAQDKDNLIQAWEHVQQRSEQAEAGEALELEANVDSEPAPVEYLQEQLERVFWGQYTVPPLRGYLIPKTSGGMRALAIPPFKDRVLQRAVQQIVAPALEPLFSTASHGFRQGLSRITASQAIQQAWQEGYQWVYEGDIRDFFDSVSWQRLEQRLNALFFNDPLIPALLAWIQAPVVFEAQTIARQAGLPQGSPLSPVLANLMLDDFDHDMEAAGFRLIRFADDFVVLCKDPEQAQAALERASLSLQEHGLAVHPDKQRIANRADGFRYLGYLFVNDLALDVGGKSSPASVVDAPLPAQSWAATLLAEHAQAAQDTQSLAALTQRLLHSQTLQGGERTQGGVTVTVTGEPAVLSTALGQLQVRRGEQLVLCLPWTQIESILVIGQHQLTTQAMHDALEQDVNVHFASHFGEYKGVLTHQRNSQHQALWLQQILTFQDAQKALYCARLVITSRLRHMKEVLRQRQLAADLPILDGVLRKVAQAESLPQLLGYEGSATREYYAKLAAILPPEFQFVGRNRRPPRDPFNVLLSLGYTQLYAVVASVLHSKGLLPWQGFYHQPHGRHAVLASDLLEPFRHLVERTAVSMILRGEILPSDFSYTPAKACLMSEFARRKYLGMLWQQWETKVTALGQTEALSWLEQVQRQAQSLKKFITEGEAFHAFRLR